jgi:hypothetical protein
MTTPATTPAIDPDAIAADFARIQAMVGEFAATLPGVLDFVRTLAANPVVPALLRAQHVPPGKLTAVAGIVDAIAELTPKDATMAQPEPAAPKDADTAKGGA